MRKQLSVIGFALSALLSFPADQLTAQENGFVLRGNLEGIQSEEVHLLLRTESGTDTLASATLSGTSFEMKGRLDEPALCMLSIGTGPGIPLFMENTEMTLGGTLPDISVSGSKSHADLEKMVRLSPRLGEIQQKMAQISQEHRQAAASQDTARANALRAEAVSLSEQLMQAREEYLDLLTRHIQTQPATHATPFMILSSFRRPDPNAFLPAFEKFPPEVKNSTLGRVLKQQLDALALSAVGKKAPEITGQTPDGKQLSLSDLKGKLTLIDFWASWCGPCRQENPNVVKLYEKYHAKGFNILGVSLDDDAGKWKQAIAADGLEWAHVSDLKAWDSELIKPYAVNAIPHTVLVDENGIIIASNLRGADLEEKVAEVLGDN